jgi:hypothetical protein
VLRNLLIVAAAGNAVLGALRLIEYLNTRRFEIGLNAGSDRRVTAIPGELLSSLLSLLLETALWPLPAALVIRGALWSALPGRGDLGPKDGAERLAFGWMVVLTLVALNIRWRGFTTGNGDDFELLPSVTAPHRP